MVAYELVSDNVFIQCGVTSAVMQVYELEAALNIAPVGEKNWRVVAKVGPHQELYDALKVGHQKEIRGESLKKLMEDVYNLRFRINRQGLCFLATTELTVGFVAGVEYYRMYDLFDWSNYGVVHEIHESSVYSLTRTDPWIRCDIVKGRPLLVARSRDEDENGNEDGEGNGNQKLCDEEEGIIKKIKDELKKKEEELRKKDKELEEIKRQNEEDLNKKEKAINALRGKVAFNWM